jgi:hypothetical protein
MFQQKITQMLFSSIDSIYVGKINDDQMLIKCHIHTYIISHEGLLIPTLIQSAPVFYCHVLSGCYTQGLQPSQSAPNSSFILVQGIS